MFDVLVESGMRPSSSVSGGSGSGYSEAGRISKLIGFYGAFCKNYDCWYFDPYIIRFHAK